MARFGFAIDDTSDLLDLRAPRQVSASLARLIGVAIGDDILICRPDELGATYVGLCRLRSINLAADGILAWITFDRPRPFDSEAAHLGRPVACELYVLDDTDFATIVERGQSSSFGAAERRQAEFDATPELGSGREGALPGHIPQRCAFTGEPLPRGTNWTIIWHEHPGFAGNLLPFAREASMAFMAGQFSARDDLSIIIDATIDRSLLRRMNDDRRLLVPDAGPFRPSADCLGWHRSFIARLA